MAYDTVIVRYGEIFLKSEYVRRSFEDILVGNIRRRLANASLDGSIYRRRHRIYINTDRAQDVCESLKTVCGIVSLSPAVKVRAGLGEITECAVSLAKKVLGEGVRFAVRAQRSGKHSFSSKDVEVAVGARILEEVDAVVDLEDPEKTVYVEVRDDEAFVFDIRVDAVGGLPYGSQGRLIALLSTGIDSPVAAWMMMRRGCTLSFLHYGCYEEIEPVVKRLEYFADEKLKVCCVPYDPILEKISGHAGKYTCVVCKRFMHRAAEMLAGLEEASGIVSGENIGQVASQTLENLLLIDCLRMPVYRPLVAMDKEGIIDAARKIGTYELAKKGVKCRFVPEKPSTRAGEDVILEIEKEIGIERLLEDVRSCFVFGK